MESMLQYSTSQSFGTDCKDLIAMIKEPHAWPSFATKLERIATLKICFPNFKITHIPRAQNQISDSLAKTASRNSARVAWDVVVRTKSQGGLGVKNLQVWNRACCLRLIWLLFFRSGSVWVAWFKEVVLKGSLCNYWTMKPNPSFSWLANKLIKMRHIVFPLIKMRVQNGLWTRFWSDNWTPFGSLDVFLNSSLSRLGIPIRATVASICRNGNWRLSPARSEQQLQLQRFLTTVELNEEDDHYEWEIHGNIGLKFSTGEVYTYLSGDAAQVGWAPLVWIKRGIPRQSFHVWLVAQNRLPTRDRLLSWGIQTDHLCLLCNNHGESQNHLFQECDYSYELWRLITTRLGVQPKRTWEETTAQLLSLPSSSTHTRVTLLAW
ncbi:PREDICTED: uncharacterized protein LOC106314850 [Brassica oleracea var. oleracea]|uniref:uncharacterized protein LOC106314850 n=1 Tax=Brassica oleracea var. oleracea TaxID=109376 RepID=UPI0006A6F2AD|nr:PREDICTED: uncharacterized protein LOC106314850 [Brassica oleracea var. oleracea]